MNGTPLPHEEPQMMNPPSGVWLYYWVKSAAAKPLKLELLDGSGAVRATAATDMPLHQPDTETINGQAIWEQPAQPPSAAAGMHRFALGGAAERGGRGGVPAVRTGEYTVRLTVDGQTYTQPLTVKPDPRDPH
jgi:hypothetical protein